jgi:ankyrin repeat protein
MLLAAGAKPAAAANDVEPLLIVAIDKRYDAIASSLLHAGAAANGKDSAGRFPLGAAAERGAVDTISQLLKSGANPNLVDAHGRTALMLAAANNAGPALAALLAQGAAADSIDAKQRSALWYAAGVCDPLQLTQLLTSLRAYDASQRFTADADGVTPLHRAVSSHSASCVETLLSAGHETKAASTSGSTPLHLAALEGELKIGQLLADAGAPLDARDVNGDTPLYLATKAHAYEMTQFLLQRGANSRIRNNNAVSAYDIARKDSDPRWLRLFDEQAPSVLSLLGSNR